MLSVPQEAFFQPVPRCRGLDHLHSRDGGWCLFYCKVSQPTGRSTPNMPGLHQLELCLGQQNPMLRTASCWGPGSVST